MNTQEFEIVAPGKQANLFPLFIGLLLPLLILGMMLAAGPDARDWMKAAAAAGVLPVLAGVLAWSMHHRRLRLEDSVLLARRWPWPLRASAAEFDLAQARIVDLAAHPDLHPGIKLIGSRIPGYRSGWFWLRDRRRAYVVLTDWRRVLVLPRLDGTVYLFSPERPEALLDALRRQSR